MENRWEIQGVSENGKPPGNSLKTSGCKAKSAGILYVFRAFLTQQMLFSVEFAKGLEFSECPCWKQADARQKAQEYFMYFQLF